MKQTHTYECHSRQDNDPRMAARRLASRGERGQSMIELALILPVLLLLTLGVIELGRAASYYLEVVDATKAGAQYGSQTMANAENRPNILQAAQSDAVDLGGGLTLYATYIRCVCPGTGVASPCTGTLGCSYPTVYLAVQMQYPYRPLFNYPGISNVFTMDSLITTAVQRQ